MKKDATLTGVSRAGPDWEAIERDYRAGSLTLRAIASQHGITEGAIRKRAKKDSWARDLTVRVQEAVRSELVRKTVRTADQATEDQIVSEAAERGVLVVLQHRKHISGLRMLTDTLAEQLAGAVGNRSEIEDAIFDETHVAEDAPPPAERAEAFRRRNAMMKAVALPSHIVALKDLSATLKNLIPLERQAFNVGDEPPPPPPADESSKADGPMEDFLAKLRKIVA